jgi:hypothetical protein
MICVPTGINEAEEMTVINATNQAGARQTLLIEEPVAAALGAGIDINAPEGHLVVDIGGGTTDIAVISYGGVVVSESIKIAGNELDEAIMSYIRKHYKVLIGERTAEEIKIRVGRVFEDKEAVSILKNKRQISTREILKPYYKAHVKDSNLVKRQIIDYYFWLVRDFLHAVDRNTMMFGLEARTPFLDDAVYSVARTLPQEAKINKTTTKPALRLAASKVIPNEAYKKKKLGFPVPLREWIREEDLYQEIKRAFNSPAAAHFFDVSKINRLLEQHKSGKKDCYKKVWTIYTFIIWYEQFFE